MGEHPRTTNDGAIRRGLVWTFRRVMSLYFRDIEATGAIPGRETGGRVFVGNHMNGLVDPILVLTSAPCAISPIAKSTLWKIPGLKFLLDAAGAVPLVRKKDDPNKKTASNEEIFDKVANALAGGQNILIFPEGTSHNEPQLLELKTGAARMLARAKDRGGEGLTFQAVALEFEAREKFRSRSLLVYGPVRKVDELGKEGAELVAAITEVMREDLSELLVEGATWSDRVLIARVAEMLANDAGDGSLERWNAIGRQVEAARKRLGGVEDGATVAEVAAAVDRYFAALGTEGFVDAQIAAGGAAADDGPDALLLALLAPFALFGTALYALPYQVTRFASQKKNVDADERSTIKLGVGLLVYPVWAAALIGGGFALLPAPAATGFAALALTTPFAALAWRDQLPRLRRALRFRAHADRVAALREARDRAMALVNQTRAELGLG
jgi:1-acyl-sn-glycerol-3-phosphate acyltransferase